MKFTHNLYKSVLALTCTFILSPIFAGNPERQGSAGAAQLTINSFGRSSGMGWAAGSKVTGLDGMFLNIAGLDKSAVSTDIAFYRTQWLVGSGIGINNFSLSQKLGENKDKGTIGFSVMQFGIKPIQITTENNPHGGIGEYRVNMSNIGIGYSKSFGTSISAGVMARYVTESIPDASANGFSLDAGVQYSTSVKSKVGSVKDKDLHLGIALKNIGGNMRHTGQGLTYKAILSNGDDFARTVSGRADAFKLPALLNMSLAYDIRFDKNIKTYNNKLTLAFGVTTFGFQSDQVNFGAEYSYKDFFFLRAGMAVQKGTFGDQADRTSAFTGLSGGISYDYKTSKGKVISFDYSYRHSNPFSGAHSFGLRFGIGE